MAFYNVKDFSYLLKQDCTVVITGDSLAYNRYDFVDEPRMNAWDCPFAMQSWSFLLRDFLIAKSSGWITCDEIKKLIIDNIPKEIVGISSVRHHDERLPLIEQLPVDSIVLDFKSSCSADLFSECPGNICCITKSDEMKVALDELDGNEELFNGRYYKWIKKERVETYKEGTGFTIAGAAESTTEVFLTGSGSKTGEWLLENIEERILMHKPNLTIMIIGANNRRENNPKSFKAALYEMVKKILAVGSEIILISPPHSTTTDPAWGEDNKYTCNPEVTKPILDILKEAAFEYDLPYVDLFEFFSGVPNDIWRFDNTHFTRQGNLLIYNALINQFFTGG